MVKYTAQDNITIRIINPNLILMEEKIEWVQVRTDIQSLLGILIAHCSVAHRLACSSQRQVQHISSSFASLLASFLFS